MIITDVVDIVDPRLGIVSVDVVVDVDGHIVDATGSAKVHGPDTFDPSLGRSLATARALKAVARKLERNANNEIQRRDRQRVENEARDAERRKLRQKRAKKIRQKLGIED